LNSEEDAMTQIAYPKPFSDELGLHLEDSTREAAIRTAARAGARPWSRWLEPSSLVPTYVGVLVIAVGFALIGIAWAEIAALTNVGLQMPYLVSAGITGLALVMVGLIVVNVAARRQDGAERARQMQTLTETFQALQQEIAGLDLPRGEA
jgi:hypothetical protein